MPACVTWSWRCGKTKPATPLTDDNKLALLDALERALCEENVEYEAKRESERLAYPVLKIVAAGTYDKFKQKRAAQGARCRSKKRACASKSAS